MISKNNNRLLHFDLMRIIASFLVILIHVNVFEQSNSIGDEFFNSVFTSLYSVCARWAVPCFLMLSGLLF